MTKYSSSVFYEREFIYEEIDKTKKAFPLWIDERSVKPAVDLDLLPEDIIRVSFMGSLGQKAFVEIIPGGIRIECSREDQEDYSLYQADLALRKLALGKSYKIVLKLTTSVDTIENSTLELPLQNSINVRATDDFPLVKIIKENSR